MVNNDRIFRNYPRIEKVMGFFAVMEWSFIHAIYNSIQMMKPTKNINGDAV